MHARAARAAAYAREVALTLLSALIPEQDSQHEVFFGCQLIERSHGDALCNLDEAHLAEVHVQLARSDGLDVHGHALTMQTLLHGYAFVLGHGEEKPLPHSLTQLV